MLRPRPSAPHFGASPWEFQPGNAQLAHLHLGTAGASCLFSLGMLHCEGYGSLDLGDTYQNSAPSTFGTSLGRFPERIPAGERTPRAFALGDSWGFPLVFFGYAPLRRLRIARSRRNLPSPFQETHRLQFLPMRCCVMHTITNVISNLLTTTSHKCRTWKDALSTNSPQWRIPLTRILVTRIAGGAPI